MKEFHTDLPCKFCKKGFPKTQIIPHMAKCDERPAECKFCHLNVSLKEKSEHEYLCGSKTEYCANCKKYITLKTMQMHQDYECFPEETYLSNHMNVEKIPVIMNRRQSKQGKIATAMNLLKEKEKEKNVHQDLAEQIANLEKKEIPPPKKVTEKNFQKVLLKKKLSEKF